MLLPSGATAWVLQKQIVANLKQNIAIKTILAKTLAGIQFDPGAVATGRICFRFAADLPLRLSIKRTKRSASMKSLLAKKVPPSFPSLPSGAEHLDEANAPARYPAATPFWELAAQPEKLARALRAAKNENDALAAFLRPPSDTDDESGIE
jgi:hypothetical protein